ncbi:MAG: hypothetical protein P1V36_02320, partial [Planctomycetota bacterium]|nr:hypothetical protein [Planctomycetota bacterium]
LNPYDYTAYQSLADRYVRAGDQASAERARTTLAEVAPHQAAGHRALATIRTKQKRLPEALVQWRQVVRTERLDPTGHLALARALIDTGASEEARAVLQGVLTGTWESRFGDVKLQAGQMLGTLGAKR